MSTGVGVNVLRYSALGLGIFYGAYHQMTLKASARAAAERHEYQHKSDLISRAKEEYKKKHAPAQPAAGGQDQTITDPEDPQFDLEKFLNAKAEENS